MPHLEGTGPLHSQMSLQWVLWRLKVGLLWVLIASSWFVFIEPAPYDYFAFLLILVALCSGLRFHLAALPLLVLCFLYNLGGLLSLLPFLDDQKSVQFVATSVYMGVTAVVLSGLLIERPGLFLALIRNAWILAGVVAASLGIMGYFDLFGTLPLFAPALRATGTFKDPNVFSTYLIPPIIFLLQGFVLGTQRYWILSMGALLLLLAAVFLAFSRGAWGVLVGSSVLFFIITFLTHRSARMRMRVVLLAFGGVVVCGMCLLFLLSFETVRDMFLDRAVLLKEYDAGETGRFANQIRSIPVLLSHPNGLGPFGFSERFSQNPHNVYLFAFAAYGWLGGVSYLLLAGFTCVLSWKQMFIATPWREHAIAMGCPLILMILQGFQIDTDHWRHFYLLLGIVWGMSIASLPYLSAQKISPAPSSS